MPLTYTSDQDLYNDLAGRAAGQMICHTGFTRAVAADVSDYNPNSGYEIGSKITISRPKNPGPAQKVDPRSGSAVFYDTETVDTTVKLTEMAVCGFNQFSVDANPGKYVRMNSQTSSDSVGWRFEIDAVQLCFENYTNIPTIGTDARIADLSPLQIVFSESQAGTLQPLTNRQLAWANATLTRSNVSPMDRFFFGSSTAMGDWAESLPSAEGQTSVVAGGGQILIAGVQPGSFSIPRHGFRMSIANTITGQDEIADLGDGNSSEDITEVVNDTIIFLDGEQHSAQGNILLGAVRLTLGIAGGILLAIGDIVRVGPSNGPATAYGVVLRVDNANKYVWIVPYNSKGEKLVAAQIKIASDLVSVPAIASKNVAYQKEFMMFGSRPLHMPPQGSGAMGIAFPDTKRGLVFNLLWGAYSMERFKSAASFSILYTLLPTAHQKAVFVLTG
ncbi:MAG: hypothetical protein J7647_32120 [Cyanobacteria bacterium SBLK]|nr:hypothetical protein [Cyanobacteria bacterium SBLK]